MPKAEIKAPKVDISLPSVDVSLPKASVDLQAPEAALTLEGEAKAPEKEAAKTKDGKFKMPKFGMPSFGWASSREAKGTTAAEVDVSLKEPQVTGPSGTAEVDVTLPGAEIQVPISDVAMDFSSGKEVDMGKAKSSLFRVPKVSLSKSLKSQAQRKSSAEISVSEALCYSLAEDSPAVISASSGSKSLPDNKGDSISKNSKFRIPSLGFSKVDIGSSKIEQDSPLPKGDITLTKYQMHLAESESKTLSLTDENLAVADLEILNERVCLEEGSLKPRGKTTSAEISMVDTEVTVKIHKFRKPKFGISWSKGKPSEGDIGSKVESEISKRRITSDMTDTEKPIQTSDSELVLKMHKASPEVVLDAPVLDVSLQSVEVTMPKLEVEIHGPGLECKAEQEVVSGEKDTEEKEKKFRTSKFKLPSFSWSPKKEAVVPSEGEGHLEEPSFPKIKGEKFQDSLPILETDVCVPKQEKEYVSVQKSEKRSSGEGAGMGIKMPKVTVSTLEFSKPLVKAPKIEMDTSMSTGEVTLPTCEEDYLTLKSAAANASLSTSDIKMRNEGSLELKSPDTTVERSSEIPVGDVEIKIEGPEGKPKVSKFQMPKFGITHSKGKGSEKEVIQSKSEVKVPQLKAMVEIGDIAVEAPNLEVDWSPKKEATVKLDSGANLEGHKLGVTSSRIDTEVKGSATDDQGTGSALDQERSTGKVEQKSPIKKPQFAMPKISLSKIKVPKSQTYSPKVEADATIPKTEREGDVSIQIPDIERSHSERTEEGTQISIKLADVKIPTLEHYKIETGASQTEIGVSSAKIDTSLPLSEGSSQQVVLKLSSTDEDTVEKAGIKFPTGEASVELRSPEIVTERSSIVDGRKMKLEGPEGKIKMPKFQKPKFGISLTKGKGPETEISSPKPEAELTQIKMTNEIADSAVGVPASELTSDHKVKSHDTEVPKVESSTKLGTLGVGCKPSAAEITLDATQEKINVSLPKEELDIQNQEGLIKKGKIKGEMKVIGKDSEGSQLKRPTCEWSTTKGSEDGAYVAAKPEDLKVEVPGVKMDARVDPEMKFQVKSVEKDMSAGMEVQVEDRAETSKIKTYKFKIPKFRMLHSEVKGFEGDINLPKSEADSISETEIGTAEMQFQKRGGSIGLKSPALDHMEASARTTVETVDKSQGVSEVNIKIPKLKIPRFTFKTLPTEADVLVSKVVADPKGSSTDIEIVQLQASSAIPEETPEALEGGIQKAKSKILTLTEPDIKTAQMTTTVESSLSHAGQDIHWSYVEGQEVSEKVEPEHVAIERCEIYTTEIVKESEILSSEVKTATLGFSLLKVKLPESHSNLEVLVQQLSTEGVSVSKPECADESFRVAAQTTDSAELKLSDKSHGETEKSGEVSLPKLKTLAVEAKPSSKVEESLPDKSPEGVTAGPLSKDEDVAEALEDEEKDITNEKEKTDSKRSPGRFKFWLPSIGFSSSADETSMDSKTEVKKAVPEDVKPADTSDNESSKQTEKTGWFRFPKLGFTSPSKKAKTVGKEDMGHKEGRISDEDSPSDKPDVFFDAQESLSPKETAEDEKVEIDGGSSDVPVSRTIVTSSARTELILLEEEKDSQCTISGDPTK
ncbi:PREDICTED: protein AHNAK2 [Pterocles gutturalis]|uniref:protein AHNAK2 n=1 Tax=Pterocles gutturalis TaxID=240206 RepID=UPI0005283501|nr:PREDICTED: protein AHNAK2 [Pterocles gutturalis]